jgi:hypothetical protein
MTDQLLKGIGLDRPEPLVLELPDGASPLDFLVAVYSNFDTAV